MSIRIKDLEDDIFSLEGVRVVFRTSGEKIKIKEYPYNRKAASNTTVGDFIKNRLLNLFEEKDNISITVINGYGDIPNIRTYLSTVRNTYRT